MNEPVRRVSVIIPLYRGEAFVRDAIASVLSQADEGTEIIVVDDASPDASAALVASLKDDRIRLLRHEANRGIAAARNTGVRAARGEFVAFLDQDDVWTPGRMAAQLAAAERAGEDAGVVFGTILVRFADGREVPDRRRIPRRIDGLDTRVLLRRLLADNFLTLASALIRRRALDAAGPFDESIRGGADDFDMVVRLAEVCRFAHVPQVALVRRVHGENFTNSLRMTDESLAVIDRTAARYRGLKAAARAGRARKLHRRATDLYIAGDRGRAAGDYRRAFLQWPLLVSAWMGWLACRLGVDARAILAARRRLRRLR